MDREALTILALIIVIAMIVMIKEGYNCSRLQGFV